MTPENVLQAPDCGAGGDQACCGRWTHRHDGGRGTCRRPDIQEIGGRIRRGRVGGTCSAIMGRIAARAGRDRSQRSMATTAWPCCKQAHWHAPDLQQSGTGSFDFSSCPWCIIAACVCPGFASFVATSACAWHGGSAAWIEAPAGTMPSCCVAKAGCVTCMRTAATAGPNPFRIKAAERTALSRSRGSRFIRQSLRQRIVRRIHARPSTLDYGQALHPRIPVVGGMLTAPLLSMLVIPASFRLLRRRDLQRARALGVRNGP